MERRRRLPAAISARYDRGMDAAPLLVRLLKAFDAARLETVLIGNAAAAIHGAPVTTLDFDFMFRATPTNLRKLKAVAAALGAVILRPYYPVSNLFGWSTMPPACRQTSCRRSTASGRSRGCGHAPRSQETFLTPSARILTCLLPKIRYLQTGVRPWLPSPARATGSSTISSAAGSPCRSNSGCTFSAAGSLAAGARCSRPKRKPPRIDRCGQGRALDGRTSPAANLGMRNCRAVNRM